MKLLNLLLLVVALSAAGCANKGTKNTDVTNNHPEPIKAHQVKPPQGMTAEQKPYFDLFVEYMTYDQNYDEDIAKLYSQDAEVVFTSKTKSGAENITKLKGNVLFQTIPVALAEGKRLNKHNSFSDVRIEVEGDQGKILATRYSPVTCNYDKSFYLLAKKDEYGVLKLYKEYMEEDAAKSCSNYSSDDKLEMVLRMSAKIVSKKTPYMVDEDTRLNSVRAEGLVLFYDFTIVTYNNSSFDDFELEVLRGTLKEYIVNEACSETSKLKKLFSRGAAVNYLFKGNDEELIVTFTIDKKVCSDRQ